MPPVLECRGLNKTYGQTVALNDISLGIEPGRIVGLLGPNGSGKTTLIKLTAGILRPTAGEVLVAGMPIGPRTKEVVSYLPEQTYLSPSMSSLDAIAYFKDFYYDFDDARALDMLQRLGVNPAAKFKTMSKGTKEKVQLIMVMSRRAQLYILDEPIGGVDPAARDYILETIVANRDPQSTVLISTHLIADVERILDDVIFLQYGTITYAGGANQLRAQSHKSIDATFREGFHC